VSNVEIAFVCVNYDGFHYTKKMVISLLNQQGLEHNFDIKIVVVDNSPEVKLELVEYCRAQPKVQYIRSEKNEGYFAGLNVGINCLSAVTYDYVVAGNNDLEFGSEFCQKLMAVKVDPRTQVICPDVITIDGVHQNPHHLNALSKKEIFAFDCYFSNYYFAITLLKLKALFKGISPVGKHSETSFSPNMEINQGVGACYVLTKAFFKSHQELFFPGFLYGEEAALSWQVRNSGGRLVYNTNLKVAHAESAALSRLPARQTYEFGKKSYWVIRQYLS
jgi:GT2 family glycosyltransferase